MPNSNKTIKRMLDDFYPYAKEYLGFDKDASISFASDKENAQNPLGKTAYYDPSNYSVTVYTDNRHPKDIMRSVSHELVHHTQNCRGDLGMSENTGEGYAQNNEHLREMEREAYEKGNLCFRDWEDGVKANLNPATIYEQKTRRSTISMQNFKNLTESFQSYLNEEGEYKAGDKVKDLRNDTVGTVVEPMAGGVIMELEDGTIVKTRDKFLEKVQGEPMQEGGSMAEYGKIDAEDGNPPSKIGRGNPEYMEAYNAVLVARGEEPLDVQQPDQAYLDALRSGKLEERAWTENDLTPDQWQTLKDIKASGKTSDFDAFKQLQRMGLADARHLGGGQYEFSISKNAEQALTDIDGGAGMNDEERRAMYDDEALSDYDDIYQESDNKIAEYGDHDTQAQGGMVSSTYSSDPEMDQVADIAATVVEQGGFLMQIYSALVDQGFSASLRGGVLMVDDKYFMGKPAKFDIGPDEPVQEVGPYVVGMMDNQMKEGEARHNRPDFFGSDEEKEMMKKMSNKEFYNYVTRDRHVVPNLKGDMGPMDGMEGPFQFKSGAVLYYDPKAGKYYDRGKDMYLDNEEASKLTMENDTMESDNNNSLREKVKTAVMSKLSEMFDDDDMYGEEDPYMAGLEAEFPWLKDKESKRMSKGDDAAMAAAARDAAAAGEFQSDEEEEMEDPTVMSETGDEDVYETTLRDRVMARVEEMINQKTVEEEQKSTEKHDDDPALKGDQDELPDELQAAIIDKADDKDKKEESLEEKKEECPNGCNCNEKENVAEAKHEEDEEEVEESIAANPEDFYRQLRNESRVVNRPEWNENARTKRSSVLNERLMKAWFDK